jgi:hypothetical protein
MGIYSIYHVFMDFKEVYNSIRWVVFFNIIFDFVISMNL